MSLTANNVAYYKMEEGSGATRIDAISGLNLTNHGNVTQVAGKIDFGSGYNPTSITVGTDWLSHATNSAFQINKAGADGFTITCWVYPTVSNQGGGIFAKGFNNGGHQLEYQLLQNTGSNGVIWQVYNAFGVGGNGSVATPNQMTLNAWNFIWCWYRSSDGQVGVQIGCSNPTTDVMGTNAPFNGTGDFMIGKYINNVDGFWAGRVDEFSIWQRMLTLPEISLLCVGDQYPYTASCLNFQGEIAREGCGSDESCNAYASGVTNFTLCNPIAAGNYCLESNVVNLNGAMPGDNIRLRIRRRWDDPLNLSTSSCSLVKASIEYDVS